MKILKLLLNKQVSFGDWKKVVVKEDEEENKSKHKNRIGVFGRSRRGEI